MASLIDYILDLFWNEDAARAFVASPEQVMSDAGLAGVSAEQVSSVAATAVPGLVLDSGDPMAGLQQAVSSQFGFASPSFTANDGGFVDGGGNVGLGGGAEAGAWMGAGAGLSESAGFGGEAGGGGRVDGGADAGGDIHAGGDTHAFEELRLLSQLHSRPTTFNDDELVSLRRIIGGSGTDTASRLGLSAEASDDGPRAAFAAAQRWRRRAEHPLNDPFTTRACRAAVRSAEAIVAECQVAQTLRG